MNNYGQENEYGLSISSIIGIFLTVLGVGIILWVAVSIYLLFTDNSAFFMMDNLLPAEVVFGDFPDGELLVPREFFVFGVPLSALSIGARIGIALLKNGVNLIEKPNKNK